MSEINWERHKTAAYARIQYFDKDDRAVGFQRVERPQTKPVADEGEKWTHTYLDYGVRKDCVLVCDKPDIHGQVLALNRYDEYVLTGTVELKPIKPKLTKSEYELLARMAASFCIRDSDFDEYMSKFDTVEII